TGTGTVAVTAGTMNVNTGYTAVATTVAGGTANFNGAQAHSTGTLTFSSGALGGTGNLTVNNAGIWSGGQLSGGAASLTIANGAIVNMSGAGDKVVDAATLTNAGAMNLTGSGNLVLNNGATISNNGSFNFL